MIFPLPPWSFPNARVLYQPTFVPIKAARAVTPTTSNQNNEGGGGLTLLSLFGYTLGGLFLVEWTHSPIGPYREVAVLSGLVLRDFSIGAWASHIVVTSPEAVESGRDLFGLPTVLGSIDFGDEEEDDNVDNDINEWYEEGLVVGETMGKWIINRAEDIAVALKYAAGTAVPGIAEPAEILNRRPYSSSPKSSTRDNGFVWNGDTDIRVNGWNGWKPLPDTTKNEDELSNAGDTNTSGGISLPSFSGRLNSRGASDSTTTGKNTPLLRYPLRLVSARSLRLRPALATKFASNVIVSEDLRAVLDGPRACPCIQVDGVMVVAGKPVEIAP